MNRVELIGSFTKEFVFNHKLRNKSFYISEIAIPRDSGLLDVIPVIVEESAIPNDISPRFYLCGSFRVFNKHNRSYRYIYPECIYPVEEFCKNEIELDGTLYDLVRRKTPLGKRIADAMIRVNRTNGVDSIPLIFWNDDSNGLNSGDFVHIKGRIQSRTYEKHGVFRTINEISVSKIL